MKDLYNQISLTFTFLWVLQNEMILDFSVVSFMTWYEELNGKIIFFFFFFFYIILGSSKKYFVVF